MFDYILAIIHAFERKHGRRPQLVCLNADHMRLFMEECPDLFDPNTAIPLGFRIMVLPASELAHPKAVWLPPRVRATRRALPDKEPELISWKPRKQNKT
jgi:hypothetical protein